MVIPILNEKQWHVVNLLVKTNKTREELIQLIKDKKLIQNLVWVSCKPHGSPENQTGRDPTLVMTNEINHCNSKEL